MDAYGVPISAILKVMNDLASGVNCNHGK